MTNKQKKIIENYVIQDAICTYPDSSQYFKANHKILKKTYTIRKVKYREETRQVKVEQRQINGQSQQIYLKIRDEININKRLNGEGALKCHQLIRTTKHLYIVYDAFPNLNLREYIMRGILAKNQKIQLFQRIIQTLKKIHQLGVVVVQFSLDTIRVDQDKNVIFTDLTCARFLLPESETSLRFSQPKQRDGLSVQFSAQRKLGISQDVLMLGKLFIKVIREFASETSERYRCLLDIIELMTVTQPKNRLSLEEALLKLQKVKTPKQRKFSDQYSNTVLLDPLSSYKAEKNRKLSYQTSLPNESTDIDLLQKEENNNDKVSSFTYQTEQLHKKSNLASANETLEDNYSEYFQKIGENLSSTKSDKTKTNTQQNNSEKRQKRVKSANKNNLKGISELHKRIIKKRNLAFFIFDLSQFVVKQETNALLGYLLVKYACLTLSSCVSQIQKANLEQKYEIKLLHEIILNQKLKMTKILIKMVEFLKEEEIDVAISFELMQQKTISEKLLNGQILQFAKEMLHICGQSTIEKKPLKQLGEYLFKTYMLLKKIEIGSYQRFWDSIYNEKYVSLNHQRYLFQQKQLGFRYFRTKIQEIIRSK